MKLSSLDHDLPEDLVIKIDEIRLILTNKKVVIAYSGGVDSSLLLALASKFCSEIRAVFFDSPLGTATEKREALEIAKKIGVSVEIIPRDPLGIHEFTNNNPDRCYHCKLANFKVLEELRKKIQYDMVIDGSNADDTNDFRPGMRALDELGVLSPLKSAGLTKADIRFLAGLIELDNAEKPSNACLASRVAYGVQITSELLDKIDKAEEYLKNVFNLRVLRARVHEGNLLRIELLPADLKLVVSNYGNKLLEVVEKMKKLGFRKVTLDLEGYRTGSLNDFITRECE